MTFCTATPPSMSGSGDDLYGPRSSDQSFIDWVRGNYPISPVDWGNGFGWNAPTDFTLPFGRTLNAIWCLEYSSPTPSEDIDGDAPILNWAGRFARENFDSLEGHCGDDWVNGDGTCTNFSGTIAHTTVVPLGGSTELYVPFFYCFVVSKRAAVLIHEARHANGVMHDDDNFDSSWEYNGAWRWEVCWLAWFANLCPNASPPMKQAAVDRANIILGRDFTRDPGFRIGPTGIAFQVPILQVGTPILQNDAATNFTFGVADYDGHGRPDLYCFKHQNTGTGMREIHVLNGADAYQSFLDQIGTPIEQGGPNAPNFTFALGDYDGDGTADVYCLKSTQTGTGTLEVHVLNGADNFQSFLQQTGTPISAQDAEENFAFAVGDYDGDGMADLYCLKLKHTDTGTLEVHVLNGADNFQSFLQQTGTPISAPDAAENFAFAVGDYDGDGMADLYCLKLKHTGTGTLEVHVLNGADGFQSFLTQTGTPISSSDVASNFAKTFGLGDWDDDDALDVYCFKDKSTGTGKLEVHVVRIS